MRAVLVLTLATLTTLVLAQPHAAPQQPFQALPEIAPAPEFVLTSQDGSQVALADFRGKVVAVTFIFTMCTLTCPVLTPMMSFVQDRLGPDFGERIAFVSITVDPERDTPEVLKSYVESFDTPIVALTGTAEEVKEAAKAYRVYYAKHPRSDGEYDMDHSAVVYVMDPSGRFTATFTPDSTAQAIAERLQKLLS